MASKEKYLYLESIRGILATYIIFVHGREVGFTSFLVYYVGEDDLRVLVDSFFVMSGFVIALSYSDKLSNFASVAIFQYYRFLRMYPLHLLTFLLFALFFPLAEYLKEIISGDQGGSLAFANFDLSAVINNLFLTQAIFEKNISYNYPSWSVSVEFYTYAMFAGLFFIVSSKYWRIVSSILVIILCGAALYITDSRYPETGMAFVRCIYAFFMGVLLYYASNKYEFRVPSIFVYGIFVFYFVSLYYGRYISPLLHPLIYVLMYLFLLKSDMNYVKRLLNWAPLVFLGTVSYGMYMIHTSVWFVVHYVMANVLKIPVHFDEKSGYTYLVVGPWLSTAILISGACVTIFLAYLSYRYFEMPLTRLGRKITNPSKSNVKSDTVLIPKEKAN